MQTGSRKLNIGGVRKAPGWEILNIQPLPDVDHQGDARDLSRFPDGTFSVVYASHIVEHLDYAHVLPNALKEWLRVLIPGGTLYISAPDLNALARLFIDPSLDPMERFHVMTMVFGGHVDKHDYHLVGFDQDILAKYLYDNGFVNVRRVGSFRLFSDSSETRFRGVPISINLVADKPG